MRCFHFNWASLIQDLQIVVLEDNQADLFLFKKVLESFGKELGFTHFKHGNSFLDAIQKKQLPLSSKKLVFVDYNLPRSNGWEIIQSIIDLPDFKNSQFVLMSNLIPNALKDICNQYLNII